MSATNTDRAQQTDVLNRIRQALERNADIEASHITVSIKDGIATLRGTARAWIERTTAEQAAKAVPGIVAVKNEITIGSADTMQWVHPTQRL